MLAVKFACKDRFSRAIRVTISVTLIASVKSLAPFLTACFYDETVSFSLTSYSG